MKNSTLITREFAILSIALFFFNFSYSQYCSSNGDDTTYEYIDRVQLASIDNNTSGAGTTSVGYSDFTGTSTDLNRGTGYTITITPTWPNGTPFPEAFRVWIDYNQDDDFNDPGEEVWSQTATTTSPVSGSFTVPATATLGNTRMRVSMRYNNLPSPCGNFDYGEVEDYTVNIVEPEINVRGNGVDIADNDLTPSTADDTDFGSVGITSSTKAHTFTVQNTGTGGLSLTGSPLVSITGAHASDFTVTATPSASIAASGSTTFTITFDPSAVGLRTASVSIANDDPDEDPYNFNIQGTGSNSTPEINVKGNGVDIADNDLTPSSADNTDFRNLNITTDSYVYTYTIENTGTGTLSLTGSPLISITGAHASDFTVTTNPSASIAASGSTTFSITFDPSAVGLRTASVSIANDDSDEDPYNFNIQGTGTNSPYCISYGNDTFSEYISRVQLASIDNTTGDGYPTRGYEDFTGIISTDLNKGTNYTMTITPALPGGSAPEAYGVWIDYNQDDDFDDPGEMVISQAPTTANPVSNSFTVPATATTGNTRMRVSMRFNVLPSNCGVIDFGEVEDYTINITEPEINVRGNGVDIADNDLTPSTADDTDFGNVDITSGSDAHTFTIQNTGTGSLSLTGSPLVSITGAHASDFTVTANPSASVGVSGSTTFTITFDPSATGLRTASVSIANDDSDENPYNFNIQGTGTTTLYCTSYGNNTFTEYIGRVQLGSIDNTSGDGSPTRGYEDFTATLSTDLNRGTNYTITITPTFPGGPASEAYGVWIDYNQDLDFDDPGELVWSQSPTTASPVSGSFTVPATATPGNTRMRVSMQYNLIPPPCGVIGFGEVEDYTVNIAVPDINVRGNGVDIANNDLTPSTADDTDFGSVDIGSGGDVHTFTIQNTGTGSLSLTGSPLVSITGAHASDFTVSATPSASVGVSGSTTFSIAFDPLATGLRTASVSIANDDPDEAPYTFNIQGTGTTPSYCTLISTDTSFEYIGRVQLGSIDNTSGDGSPTRGYEDFTATQSTDVTRSTMYTITITPIFPGGITSEGYAVWIDYNQDFDFDDPGELVFSQTPTTADPVSGSFTIPATATPGNTRMRVAMQYNTIPSSSCGSFSGGEVEDYTVNIAVPQINVKGNGVDIADNDLAPSTADDTNFGNVSLSSSVTKTYTIESVGSTDLDVSSITLSNISGSAFSLTTNPAPATISTGNSITFSVTFSPLSEVPSPYEADITIANNDPDSGKSSYNFRIQGNGVIAPGSVSSQLQLWLKANEGTALTGTDVDSWTDQSPNAIVGTSEGTLDAEYVAEGLNCNPVLRFNGSSFYNLGNQSVLDLDPHTDDMTIITVVVSGNATTGTVISKAENSGPNRNYQVWFDQTDRVLHHTLGRDGANEAVRWGTVYALNEPKITSGVVSSLLPDGVTPSTSSTRLTPYVNGYLDPADNNDGTYTGGDSTLDVLVGARRETGNTGSGSLFSGDIAEIIVYDRGLTALERQKIESYLAIKYGVTLGFNDALWDSTSNTSSNFGYSGTSNDYLASDGTIIWDGSQNAGYGYNVLGLMRDDNSELLQLKSKSSNVEEASGNTSILTVEDESSSIADDKSYLLVGNNGGTVAFQSTTLPERATNTLNRKWKARASANKVGTVELAFDLTQYPSVYGTAPNDIELLVSANENLSNYKNYEGTYNAANKTITFTGVDFDDSAYFTLGTPEELDNSHHMDFDGSSQYIDLADNNDLTGSFTISAWVKRSANNGAIVSKGGSSGYEFAFNGSGNLTMSWQNSGTQSVTSTNSVPLNIWHHVAVIYNQTTAKLYIDGVEDGSANISTSPIANASSCFIGASSDTPSNFFSGEMDELRIWNLALTVDQLRFIMNQEIEVSGGNVYGKIIPNGSTKHETSTISWSDLTAYYPFTSLRGNCLFNKSSNTTQNGRLYNVPNASIQSQTSPLPFVSNANADWDTSSTWQNGADQYVPNSTIFGTDVDWNIVETNHNIEVNRDVVLLGLISSSNAITVQGDSYAATPTGYGLTITHYLRLDGTIDLEGESQLVQTEGSDFDASSTGSLDRDQQGTSNTYTYNYWSSPVAPTSNGNQTLANVISNVGFISTGHDGTTSPVRNAEHWIYKYANNPTNNYSEWSHVGSTGTISAGEGFTMKGPGTVTADQNYIFSGQPNNGDITLTISKDNDYLIGNPYPSAIDADEFIKDNISAADGGKAGNTVNVINGALYFWDHFSNSSHYLSQYQGGYATYTLMGGVVAVNNDARINATGSTGTKIPERYIPVGQGFFVYAGLDTDLVGEPNDPGITQSVDGGTITFKNSQRVFQKEIVSGSNTGSLFIKNGKKQKTDSSAKTEDTRSKIKLMFDSPDGYHRQLLVGADQNASDNFDLGYDAILTESNDEDMYWSMNNSKLSIQAVNKFDKDQTLPLGIKIAKEGLATISIDNMENIKEGKPVYVHDLETNTYHNLIEGKFMIVLTPGEYANRFEITFAKQSTMETEDFNKAEANVYTIFSNEKESVIIYNPDRKHIQGIALYNALGQSVFESTENSLEDYLEFKVRKISAGAYIVKLKIQGEIVTKKIVVK